MKSNFICASVLFLAFFISTGFVFSTSSSIDFEKNNESQTNFILQDTSKEEEIERVFTIVEESPTYEGGMNEFYKYISENLTYPPNAKEKNITGKVFIQFVVDKDGSIVDAKVVKSVDKELDAEALRVIQNSPKWIAGKQRGKNVKVRMNIPIVFTLDKASEQESIFTIVEKPAHYKGGMDAFYKYVRKNLKYPESALESELEGRVFVVFVVDKEGNITETSIGKSLSPDCDAEAIRLLEESNQWTPAEQRGRKVKVRMNIPIVFKLDPKEVKKYKKAQKKKKG
ncbi:energy transducer TonB [Bernardetia sp. ABR2-2B]|uniref:energy transducer TonB n=1 Tax=Bernardetia sp. ABR2-2B TaxID=3127472 RepID=UPI0030CF26C8